MKHRHIVFTILLQIIFSSTSLGQIDSLFVEKYYISDANDATDTIGGGLEEGSITYRIFLDLADGCKLVKLYGDLNHQIIIKSTDYFFNHTDRGKSTGKEISSSRLKENTLALDTWISIGQASDIHLGSPKPDDTTKSVIGGSNNDGGSSLIPGGLLTNNVPDAGIPLTYSDGLINSTLFPQNLNILLNGKKLNAATDTTIFGSLIKKKIFYSRSFSISTNGFESSLPGNKILLAQLTTKGELSFEFNIEIEQKIGLAITRMKYVARDPVDKETTNRYLIYPPLPPPCGCKDPEFIEFSKEFECHLQDSCRTRIIYGCTDSLACNFNPEANFNISQLCCYPGKCNGRDITVVCPQIKSKFFTFNLFPNPVTEILSIEIANTKNKYCFYSIINASGTIEFSGQFPVNTVNSALQLDVGCLQTGIYLLRLQDGHDLITKTFIKK